jgi:hypothetical protein
MMSLYCFKNKFQNPNQGLCVAFNCHGSLVLFKSITVSIHLCSFGIFEESDAVVLQNVPPSGLGKLSPHDYIRARHFLVRVLHDRLHAHFPLHHMRKII